MGDNQQQERGLFTGLYNKIQGVKTESTQWDGSYGNPQQNTANQNQGNQNQGQAQGNYNQGQSQGNYNQGQPQGNYQGQPQGNYNQGQSQGNYNQGQPQGNYNQGQPQENYNQGQPQAQPQNNYQTPPPVYSNNTNHGAYNPSAGLAAPAGAQPKPQTTSTPNQSGGGLSFGAVVALKHNNSGRFLSSQQINYQTGSGQQQITTNQWNVTESEKWQIVSGFNQPPASQGNSISFNQIIRLKHCATGRFLHSHPNINSPISQYQEVSGFGDNNCSDDNDNWIVEKFNYSGVNEIGAFIAASAFKLKHCKTGLYLFSHEKTMQVNGATHAEVACYGNGNDENNKWIVQLA